MMENMGKRWGKLERGGSGWWGQNFSKASDEKLYPSTNETDFTANKGNSKCRLLRDKRRKVIIANENERKKLNRDKR